MEEKGKIPSEYIFGIKVFIVLYALTPFVPRFETIDPIGSHWLYIGILNVFGLLFIFKINSVGLLKQVLGSHKAIYVYRAFIIIAVLSLFNSINVFEGVRVGARIITSFIALVILYHLLKIATSTIFKFIAQTLIVVLFLVAVQVVFHFVSNWDTPRFTSLLKHSELLFGNRNITSASISILIPFCLWGVSVLKNKWKWFSLVTLFFAITAIFYIGSRSALISSAFNLICFLSINFFTRFFCEKALSEKLKSFILPIIILVVTSTILVLNTNRIDKSKSNSIGNIVSTFQAISELESANLSDKSTSYNAREMYFRMALNDIKSRPFTGVGLGNWKLANKDLYYKEFTRDKYIYPSRTHNDFLQITSETGILGGLLYLIFFLMLGYYLIKPIIMSGNDFYKMLRLALLLSLFAYGIDASLNFPLERAPIQAFLFISAAVILTLEENSRSAINHKQSKNNSIRLLFLGLLNLVVIFVLYANYKSSVAENYILADTSNKDLLTSTYTFKYDQARGKLSSIFDITSGGKPIDHYLAMYSMSEGNNDLALRHLDKAIQIAPNHYESKGLKAIIYSQRKKNIDSAIYYAQEGFQKYPAIKNNYVILLNSYKERKDTTAYFNTYDAWLDKFPNDISQWKAKAERQYEFYNNEDIVIKTIEKGILLNPNDLSLKKFKEKYDSKNKSQEIKQWYTKAFAYIKENKNLKAKTEFLKILQISPNNSATLLNLGIIEIKMKEYRDAVEHLTTIIEANNFKDGRPEYNRAIALEKLGKLELAKIDYTKSKKLGYGLAQKLPKSKLIE